MKIRATMLMLVTGAVISISGPAVSAFASSSTTAGHLSVSARPAAAHGSITVGTYGQDPWP